jgi:hypothetical protein
MTTKTILTILTLLTIYSCTNRPSSTLREKKLNGVIEQGQFNNDYLTMKILDGWTELSGNDESQFLIINKVKDNFKPNIILLALDKKQYKDNYGYETAEQYMNSLTDNFKSKPDYELISGTESVQIDGRVFFVSKFILKKGDKNYKQTYYAADIDNYFLGIVSTDDNSQLEPEVESIIQTIKFK